MNFFIITLGCKVNQYESEVMFEKLSGAGFQNCDRVEDADIVVINSCTVTAVSDQKVRQILHKTRRNNPNAVLVLTGCMPQAFPEVASGYEDADIILGNSNRGELVPAILQFLSDKERVIAIKPYQNHAAFEKMKVKTFHGRTRAFLKIEDGCNRFCSYCIIPYARGRVRSKPLDEIISEVSELSKNGYKEVVLVGINLSSYGQDSGLQLCDAVEAVCQINGIKRVRLGSLEPELMEEEVIKRLAYQEKLCPQFHLSLQSGCNDTLRRMNRHYSAEEYFLIVENLRKHFENAAITTDIMVGFPGETEQEFLESCRFVERVSFAKTHVFPYSKRPGTKAALIEDQVPEVVKKKRSKEMMQITERLKSEFLKSQIGKTEEVLFETTCENGMYEGYTTNYTPVKIRSAEDIRGQNRKVALVDYENDRCIGILKE